MMNEWAWMRNWEGDQSQQEMLVMVPTFGNLYFSRRQTLRVALSAFLCRKSASRSILNVTIRSHQICSVIIKAALRCVIIIVYVYREGTIALWEWGQAGIRYLYGRLNDVFCYSSRMMQRCFRRHLVSMLQVPEAAEGKSVYSCYNLHQNRKMFH